MKIQAWPFLIGRNKNLGYQTVVSPRFLSEEGILELLSKAAGGDESNPGEATYREVSVPLVGTISLVFRVIRPRARDYGLEGEEVLKDEGGRPIRLIEGFVVEGQQKNITITDEDLQMAHELVMKPFRAFWRAKESFKESFSLPLDLPVGNDLSSPLILIYEEPLFFSSSSSKKRSLRSVEPLSKRIFSTRRSTLILLLTTAIGVLSSILGFAVYLRGTNGNCASGTIAVGGSTALQPLVSEAAQSYQRMCPQATILVNQNAISSASGLREVGAGSIDIGNSDLQSSNSGLVDHPVAVVIYVLVLNRDVTVPNLTISQIQAIYHGSVTNWQQVGGPKLPITVVSRTLTSGTRTVFEKYVLNGSEQFPSSRPIHIEVDTTNEVATIIENTAGSIGYIDLGTAKKQNLPMASIDNIDASPRNVENGSYSFWTVEHMYTRRGVPSGLTQAFLDYMLGDQIAGIIKNNSYVPLDEVSLIHAHPSPDDPSGL